MYIFLFRLITLEIFYRYADLYYKHIYAFYIFYKLLYKLHCIAVITYIL